MNKEQLTDVRSVEELNKIAVMYLLGNGVTKDESLACNLLLRLYESGNPDVLNNLRYCEEYGLGLYKKSDDYVEDIDSIKEDYYEISNKGSIPATINFALMELEDAEDEDVVKYGEDFLKMASLIKKRNNYPALILMSYYLKADVPNYAKAKDAFELFSEGYDSNLEEAYNIAVDSIKYGAEGGLIKKPSFGILSFNELSIFKNRANQDYSKYNFELSEKCDLDQLDLDYCEKMNNIKKQISELEQEAIRLKESYLS